MRLSPPIGRMRPVKEMSLAVEWLPEEWPDYYSESEATASGNAPYNLHTTLVGRP